MGAAKSQTNEAVLANVDVADAEAWDGERGVFRRVEGQAVLNFVSCQVVSEKVT